MSNNKNMRETKYSPGINSIKEFAEADERLAALDPEKYLKLPYPYDDWVDPPIKELTDEQKNRRNIGR